MKRQLGFYLNPRNPNLARVIEIYLKHDIRHIGTDGCGGKDAALFKNCRQLFKANGLTVESIHSESQIMPGPQDKPDALRDTHKRILDRAKGWDARHVVYHHSSIRLKWFDSVGLEEAAIIMKDPKGFEARLVEELRWLCGEAGARGLNITLENLPACHLVARSMDQILPVIQNVAMHNLGICLDSGHTHCAGRDVAAEIRKAGRLLWTTHFHDNRGGGDPLAKISETDLHWVPGLGTIDWIAVVRALDEIGFKTPVVFEGAHMGVKESAAGWIDQLDDVISLTIRNWRAFEQLAAGPGH